MLNRVIHPVDLKFFKPFQYVLNRSFASLNKFNLIMGNFNCARNTQGESIEVKPKEIEYIKDSNGNFIKIGEGGFGFVSKAKCRGKYVAVKRFKLNEAQNMFDKEYAILARVSHENVVSLYGVCREIPNLCLIMELIEGNSLEHFLHRTEEEYTPAQAIDWMCQCAEGVAYLHSLLPKPVIHRDLKPSNLLLNRNKDLLKICDFGLSRERSTIMSQRTGTILYMAPEVIIGEKYTEKCDTYSFSIILWEIITREYPYKEIPKKFDIMRNVCNGRRPSLQLLINANFPRRIHELIVQCWDESFDNRPSMEFVRNTMRELSKQYPCAVEQSASSADKA